MNVLTCHLDNLAQARALGREMSKDARRQMCLMERELAQTRQPIILSSMFDMAVFHEFIVIAWTI